MPDLPLGLLAAAVLLANLAALALVGRDKRAARLGQRRTREAVLLASGLPLAAPGLIAGMALFRHKTRKPGFVAGAVAVAFANLLMLGGLGWLANEGLVKLRVALY